MTEQTAVCEIDTDCPDYRVCSFGGTAQAVCGCNTWHGRGGPDCAEWGPSTYFIVITGAANVVIPLALIPPAAILLVRGVRRFGCGALVRKATMSTVLLSVLGLATLAMHQLMNALEAVLPMSEAAGTIWVEPGTNKKQHWLRPISSAMGIPMLTLMVVATLNVSVLWLEISQRMEAMQVTTAENVQKYRRACLVAGVSLAVIVTLLSILDMRGIIPLITQPTTLTIAVLFRVGRRRLDKALTAASQMESNNKRMQEKLQQSIRDIKQCSWRVSTGYFAMLGFAGIMIGLSPPVGPDERDGCTTDQLCPPLVLWHILFLLSLLVLMSTLSYALRKARAQVDAASNNSPTRRLSSSRTLSSNASRQRPSAARTRPSGSSAGPTNPPASPIHSRSSKACSSQAGSSSAAVHPQ